MKSQTNARGILLWIDDRFAESDGTPEKAEVWSELFGDSSDRLFRLMDLSVEIACSQEEAIEAIQRACSPRVVGAYVFCILDLNIPFRNGGTPAMKHGISVGRELRRRGLPFVFFSANSNAASALDRAGLGTFPYYVKEQAEDKWRLPNSLGRVVLNEFRRNISWVSLVDVMDHVHPDSDITESHRNQQVVFEHVPFFGPFQDFVERCEYKDRVELPQAFAVRSSVEHCDEFCQQCLLLMLNETITASSEPRVLHYGDAAKPRYRERLRAPQVSDDPNAISSVRVWPDTTSVELLRQWLHDSAQRRGTTIFILPNDESADRYSELLRSFHIVSLEELPQSRWGDLSEREQLVTQSCALIFQQWNLKADIGGEMHLPVGYLRHPELLINPISWVALLEAESVARELSDPYEILKELHAAVVRLDAARQTQISDAFASALPVPYDRLLRVGDRILRSTVEASDFAAWIEGALDLWLNTSWHFPYGLGKSFAQSQHRGEPGAEPWRCRNWKQWEDHCYETLVGMLAEYSEHDDRAAELSSRQTDLRRVRRFAETLGGTEFFDEGHMSDVDWASLESLRWPHHRYPLPAAVNRRLKRAGRYLWIQQEGLDIAPSLPAGRLRYGFLGDVVEHYSSVLDWAERISDDLPLGWKSSVQHLTDVVRTHQIADAWQDTARRRELWCSMFSLLRNGAPVMLIAAYAALGKPLTGKKESAEGILSNVGGYGKILHYIKETWEERVGSYLVKSNEPTWAVSYAQALRHSKRLFDLVQKAIGDQGPACAAELAQSLVTLLSEMGTAHAPLAEDQQQETARDLFAAFSSVMADPALRMTHSCEWHSETGLKKLAARLAFAMDGPAELRDSGQSAILRSLLRTKSDYLWQGLDALAILGHVTYHFRYFDGYHFLSVLNDLRVAVAKDSLPRVDLPIIETVLELFLAGIEGLVSQLAFCLTVAGHDELAKHIAPSSVHVKPPEGFQPPSADEFSRVFRVAETAQGYAVGTLGIPGEGLRNRLCYDDSDSSVQELARA